MTFNRKNVFYPKTETRLSDEEMLSLKHRYENFNAKTELRKILNFSIGETLVSYHRVYAWGLDHLLFKVKASNGNNYVVRLNNTTVGDDYFEVEKLVYEKLEERLIQKCKIYHLERRENGNFPYDFILMDNLKEADFEKLIEQGTYTKEKELSLVYDCGKLLKKIHSIPTKSFGFFSFEKAKVGILEGEMKTWKEYFTTATSQNIKQAYDLGFIEKNIIKRSESAFTKFEYLLDNVSPVLLHGDYCEHNIIADKNNIVGVIDLTDAMTGDFMHDIAFWLAFYDFDRLNYLLKGYYSDTNISFDKTYYNKLYLYLLRINYSKAILRYKYGIPEKVPLAISKIEQALTYLELQ